MESVKDLSMRTKYRISILAIFLSTIALKLMSQPACRFEHYSTADGLPQYTIMDMLQDQKGFMWFGTWDGLSQFDGYHFRNFKVQPGDPYIMRSNRIEQIKEDKYGNIYIRTYDEEAHFFNPRTETFHSIHPVEGLGKDPFLLNDIEMMPSGRVWLLSELNGGVCILDSLFNQQAYNRDIGNLKGQCIHSVIEDRTGNTWLLTDNGLCLIPSGKTSATSYFYENNDQRLVRKQDFFKAIELKDKILFASIDGRIWKFLKKNGQFVLIQLTASSNVIDLKKLSSEKVLVITAKDGLFSLNTQTNTFVPLQMKGLSFPKGTEITKTFLLNGRQLWIETSRLGIYKYDLRNEQLRYYFVPTEDESTASYPPKTLVIEDKNHRLWIQPKGGGFSLYNPAKDKIESFYNDQSAGNWRFSNLVHSAATDRQGNLWISTRSHGLEKVVFDKNFFQTERINPTEHAVVANDVRAVFQDKDGTIFVSTKDRRVNVYDRNQKRLGRLALNGTIKPDATMNSVVYSFAQDQTGAIWMGTKGSGIIRLQGDGEKRQWHSDFFQRNEADLYSLSDNKVYSIYQDKNKRMWIGTYDGGLNLVQQDKDGKVRFISHRNDLRNYPIETAGRVRFITEDKRGHLCLGTTGGMVLFPSHFSTIENIPYHLFTRMSNNKKSLSGNDVHGICITQKGEMFIVTFGGGVNKATSYDEKGYPKTFQAFTSRNGLPSDVTLAIVEDNLGMLWISSENSLIRLNPRLLIIETFAEIKRLMATQSFSEASTCKLNSGKIIFGYAGGLLSFQPNHIKNNSYKPYLALTDFQLFNKNVDIGEKSPLHTTIDDTKNLKLSHKQNFFSIQYATLDYEEPENIQYAYKLEGFDQEWQYTRKQRIANYTNIPKGKYLFRVKSTNSEGVWVNNERTLSIEVLPSFWQTWIAYLLYLFFFGGIIILGARILITIYRLRSDVRLEKKLSDMKLRFFTDISHEIRTPLTMITAPVDYMLNDSSTPEDIRQKLSLVSHNTSRMLRLVNQILDFRKIQNQHLRVSETEVGSFVGEICSEFSELAENQHIDFKFINLALGQKIWVDRDSLEKMVINLLSNAFKYTPAGKSIRVVVRKEEKGLSIQISDKGTGISKELQKHIFTRFASYNADKNKPSTGIGLSMVKELADKHGAQLSVESDFNEGSCFTITFQPGFAHFDKDVEVILSETTEVTTGSTTTETKASSTESPHKKGKTEKYTVLIVEDDEELRSFLNSILNTDYVVCEASNGLEALHLIEKSQPGFVISDIMMPEMDGIQLLRKLREDINTSHIPIILLTAKSTIESQLEGLSMGADDYITKPFSVPYFQARIANLIQQRERLQEIYTSGLTSGMQEFDPKPFQVTPQDELFMESVVKSIEDNIDNGDFTVEDLGHSVSMSRSSFFNKVKSLTGLSPVEFIRDIRLKRAAQILTTGQFLIKEVAYMTGFSDARYFGECFKTKFGITPAEYKKRK